MKRRCAMMTREQLLDRVPPCGLICYTCPGFKDGAIKEHSAALIKLYEGYHEFLDKRLPEEYRYVLEEHDSHIKSLKKAADSSCPGCRKSDGSGPGCIKGCFIPACVKEHKVEFCGECAKFPCGRIKESNIYGEGVKKDFYEGSLLIKEQGAEKFFDIRKNISHYISNEKE